MTRGSGQARGQLSAAAFQAGPSSRPCATARAGGARLRAFQDGPSTPSRSVSVHPSSEAAAHTRRRIFSPRQLVRGSGGEAGGYRD